MNITEESNGVKIKLYKSNRDDIISTEIPENCGLLNSSQTIVISGQPGQGKSLLCENLVNDIFTYKKKSCFDKIYLFVPSSSATSYQNSYIQKLDKENIYNDLNYENLKEVQEKVYDLTHIIKRKDVGKAPIYHTRFACIIVDDFASKMRLKDIQKLMLYLIQCHRHLFLTIILINQQVQSIHKDLRDCINTHIIFRTKSLKNKKAVYEELLPNLTPNEFEEVMNYVYRDRHDFMIVNRKEDYFTRNFNRVYLN